MDLHSVSVSGATFLKSSKLHAFRLTLPTGGLLVSCVGMLGRPVRVKGGMTTRAARRLALAVRGVCITIRASSLEATRLANFG